MVAVLHSMLNFLRTNNLFDIRFDPIRLFGKVCLRSDGTADDNTSGTQNET